MKQFVAVSIVQDVVGSWFVVSESDLLTNADDFDPEFVKAAMNLTEGEIATGLGEDCVFVVAIGSDLSDNFKVNGRQSIVDFQAKNSDIGSDDHGQMFDKIVNSHQDQLIEL